MDRKQLLAKVKEDAGLESLKQADSAVRVIVGILKTLLDEEVAGKVEASLPRDLRLGWKMVEPFPEDILERADIYFGESGGSESEPPPTITNG